MKSGPNNEKKNLIGKKMILNNVKDLKILQSGLVAMWRWQKKYVERPDAPVEYDQAVIDSTELTDITGDLQAFRPHKEVVEEVHLIQ